MTNVNGKAKTSQEAQFSDDSDDIFGFSVAIFFIVNI